MKFRDDKYDELRTIICQMGAEERESPVIQVVAEVCRYFGTANYSPEMLFTRVAGYLPTIIDYENYEI